MAVREDMQGQGLGRQLVAAVTRELAESMWCDARLRAVGFYKRLGWEVVSEAYDVPQVGPHHRMVWRVPHLWAGRYVSVRERRGWEYAHRRGTSGVVAVIAHDEEVLWLVAQHRRPVDAVVIDLPAGLAGDQPGRADEDPVEAAEAGAPRGGWSCRHDLEPAVCEPHQRRPHG